MNNKKKMHTHIGLHQIFPAKPCQSNALGSCDTKKWISRKTFKSKTKIVTNCNERRVRFIYMEEIPQVTSFYGSNLVLSITCVWVSFFLYFVFGSFFFSINFNQQCIFHCGCALFHGLMPTVPFKLQKCPLELKTQMCTLLSSALRSSDEVAPSTMCRTVAYSRDNQNETRLTRYRYSKWFPMLQPYPALFMWCHGWF